MPDFVTTNGHTQIIVPLTIMPHSHQALPTVTGSPFSYEAGAVLYGHYNMEYLLPEGDRLRLIANHNKKTVQLMLFTHQPDLIELLPGDRPSSLVANVISKIHRYCIRSASYSQPLTPVQEQKLQLANECIDSLKKLLKKERRLNSQDHSGQEELRRKVIKIVGHCSDQNHLLTTSPLISEGFLGNALYEAHKTAQHYSFNRVYSVSQQDQMDFSKIIKNPRAKQKPCLIWDTELHIGHNNKDLDDALRVICNYYQLPPAANLSDVPANRFTQLGAFFSKLWRDGHDWINYLAMDAKPEHKTEIQQRLDGVTITQITPYYRLQGFPQKGYPDLKSLISKLTNTSSEPIFAKSTKNAKKMISQLPYGSWTIIADKELILIRLENTVVQLRYFVHDKLFYPLPEGQDLYTLGQISKRHLYLPERVSLRLNAFISQIPRFFYKFYNSMHRFIMHDLHDDFFNHIHETHIQKKDNHDLKKLHKQQTRVRNSLILALENKGFLTTGQTLEEFIKEQISKSPYVIARPNHPPSPHPYDNPLHRVLGVIRHIAGFFIDTSEQNPLIGTLAMAAYAYGGGAVLAPELLKSILIKLHLKGLISGIEPTQKLARWMSHGTISEAISASATYWQGMVAVGNLDKFFVEAVNVLKEDPAEIAIIASLALSLGYSLTKIIPSLGNEMGDFPYTNYAALGGKGGAAIYDTIMHPGDDWFLGTCKWLCKGVVTLGKLCIAPFFEGYYYDVKGFLKGWQKSGALFKNLSKQILAASIDFTLALLTIPLLEVSALFIHVPFRGVTHLFTKILATLGNISAIGELFTSFSTREPSENLIANFRLSPLYGFTWPFGHFSDNQFFNISINIIRTLYLPPLQLIKNLVILPIIDFISFSTRLFLTVLNPITRISTYALGSVIYTIGEAWDNSFGILFAASAQGMATACNWIDNKASALKQIALSFIENQRGQLYHWAFAQEDLKVHITLDDAKYYSSDPRRYELIPHSNSHCLLRALLNNNNDSPFSEENHHTPSHYQTLFAVKKSNDEQNITSQNEIVTCSI